MLAQEKRLFGYFRGWHQDSLYFDSGQRDESQDPRALQCVLYNICEAGERAMLILDALDEAEDASILHPTRKLVDTPSSRFEFIFLSRNDVSIEGHLYAAHRITVEEENGNDISKYIDSRL